MSIDNNLTPNQLAKLEMWDRLETVFFDGVNETIFARNATQAECDETERHVRKHMESLRKQWGMDKIFNKMGWEK